MPKNVKGGLFLIYKHALLQNNKKLKRGPFGDKKNFEKKVTQCRKNRKGGLFSPVQFCRLVCLGPLAGLGALGGFMIVSKR